MWGVSPRSRVNGSSLRIDRTAPLHILESGGCTALANEKGSAGGKQKLTAVFLSDFVQPFSGRLGLLMCV